MIGYLKGKLIKSAVGEVILDIGGVGYEVKVPLHIFSDLDKKGQEVVLYIYTHIRENVLDLYGFKTLEERKLFKTVLGVNGVGPKLALSILSGMPFEKLKIVLAQGQVQALSSIPGIGKKKAERLLIELKGKLKIFETGGAEYSSHFDDAVSALVNLGYKEQDVREKLNKIDDGDVPVEELIKGVLKDFSRSI